MARYLRDISIHLGSGQELPDGYNQKDFNISTHTVQDIFLYLIPTRFEFGNILKLNIDINGKNETLNETLNFDGYVNYSYNNFDFEEYFKLSKTEKNEVILNVLRDTIQQISVEIEDNKKKSLDIIEKIKEFDFKFTFESKLSKQQRSKKYKAIVEIKINDDGQNAFLRIVNKSKEVILEHHLVKNIVYEFHDKLYKSKWTGDTFQIIDRKGEIFKEIDIKKEDNKT